MSGASHESDDILDDEIIEIFVEETEEVIEELDNALPKWQDDPSDREIVGEIRRAYHTLKGSGRMVKAMDIADLSWKVEQMLTKALDGGVAISNSMIDVVRNTRNVIPALVDAFRNHQAISIAGINLEMLREQVDAVTRGEQFQVVQTASTPPILHVPVEQPAIAVAPVVQSPKLHAASEILQAELFEVIRRVDVTSGVADQALEESRKLATRLAQLQIDTQDLVSQADLSAYHEQQQALSKDLQDLKHFIKASTEQQAAQLAESRATLERRISEKVAAFTETKNELTDEVAVLRQALANSRQTTMKIAGGCAGAAFVLAMIFTSLMMLLN